MSSAGTPPEFDFASTKVFMIIRPHLLVSALLKKILSVQFERMCRDMCFNTEDRGEGRKAK